MTVNKLLLTILAANGCTSSHESYVGVPGTGKVNADDISYYKCLTSAEDLVMLTLTWK